MMIIEALATTVLVFVLALSVDGLMRATTKKLNDDAERMDAARGAMNRHRHALEHVLASENVEPILKSYILDISRRVPDEASAPALVRWFEDRLPHRGDKTDADEGFSNALADLKSADPQAYREMIVAMRTALVAMIMQWPDVSDRFRIMAELAGEDAGEASAAAAAVRSAATRGTPAGKVHAYA